MTLIRLGAWLLARRCRRVIIPDVCWPPYAAIATQIVEANGGEVVTMRLRRAMLWQGASADVVGERLGRLLAATPCDGMLLPAVSHDGLRLPVDRIIEQLRNSSSTATVLVDASQGIGHLPNGLGVGTADLIIAGVHKWLGAGLPLGIAVGKPDAVGELMKFAHDDPLLAFTANTERSAAVAETVNLWPLISCSAAVTARRRNCKCLSTKFATQLANRSQLLRIIDGSPWNALKVHPSLHSGIVLLRHAARRVGRGSNSEDWLKHFRTHRIELTAYANSIVRLSLPGRPFDNEERALLSAALQAFRGQLRQNA